MKTSASLRLIGESRTFSPGEMLRGEYFVEIADPHDVKSVEVSVLWFTEGKGDEDMAVHFFQRQVNDNGGFTDFRNTQQFETQLPNSPLSYEGVIVKIHWCARFRVFLPRGEELLAEQSFRLGSVPRARPWQPLPPADENPEHQEEIADAGSATH